MGLILQIYKKSHYAPLFSQKKVKKTICIYVTSAAVRLIENSG